MKTFTKRVLKLLVIGAIVIPGVSLADFKSDVIASCEFYQLGNNTKEVNACKLYIDGFIDSSLLSENAAKKQTAKKGNSQQSDFLKRAYKTRVNRSSSKNSEEVTYQFCIPVEYSRKKIASTVAKSLDIGQLEDKPLKLLVLETLMAKYPCPK